SPVGSATPTRRPSDLCAAIQVALELKPKAALSEPGKPALTAAGGVIGWASTIFGIGGGSLTAPFLVWRSVPMQQAVATSAACGRSEEHTSELQSRDNP